MKPDQELLMYVAMGWASDYTDGRAQTFLEGVMASVPSLAHPEGWATLELMAAAELYTLGGHSARALLGKV